VKRAVAHATSFQLLASLLIPALLIHKVTSHHSYRTFGNFIFTYANFTEFLYQTLASIVNITGGRWLASLLIHKVIH
jgi:hypothetical protein